MKKLILFLACVSLSFGQSTKVGGTGGTKVGGSGATKVSAVVPSVGNITVDLWQTFEGGTLDASTLQSNDNNAGATWTVTGASKDTNSAAQRTMTTTVNTVTDTGTLGFRRDNNNGTGVVLCDLNSYPTTQYAGFWFQATTLDSGSYTRVYGLGEGTEGTNIVGLSVDNAAGTYTAKLYNTGGSSSTITIAAATFYQAQITLIKNGTCLLRIYNVAGTQVGVEVSLAGGNFSAFYHQLTPAASSSSTGFIYIDNLVIRSSPIFSWQ